MNKRTLLLAVGLSAFSGRATAYTAVAVGTANNPKSEHYGYSHLPQPRALVENRALENCSLSGGPKPSTLVTSLPRFSVRRHVFASFF
jgi:hypothetical protein